MSYFYHQYQYELVRIEYVFDYQKSMDEDTMGAFVLLELLHNKPKLDQWHTVNDGKRYILKQK